MPLRQFEFCIPTTGKVVAAGAEWFHALDAWAVMHEVSRSEALRRLVDLGVEGKEMKTTPWSPEEDERIRNLARSGFSVAQIADELQRQKSAVRTRVKKMKITVARDRHPMRAQARK